MKYRVALFTDLSSLGKSSLTVMMPAFEMLGVDACPVATALLSTQSDGFQDPVVRDMTDSFSLIVDDWSRRGIRFDALYSGWFASRKEAERTARFVRDNPSLFYLCDPVLGDGGSLYQTMDPSMVDSLRSLASLASLVTPNPTEAALLLGKVKVGRGDVGSLPGKAHMVTGLEEEGKWVIALDDQVVPFARFPRTLPGAGDLFDAILLSLLVRGWQMKDAVNQCATLLYLAMERTSGERRLGVDVGTIRKELASL